MREGESERERERESRYLPFSHARPPDRTQRDSSERESGSAALESEKQQSLTPLLPIRRALSFYLIREKYPESSSLAKKLVGIN